jgi:hypothetical protein
MRRRLATPARALSLLTLAALAAALLLAAGCGGDAEKLVGTWQLDLGKVGEKAEDYSVTMTLNRDGTGMMAMNQTVTTDTPATQSQKFEWEIKNGQLVISLSAESAPQTADVEIKADYAFEKDGALTLTTSDGPTMKYTRVE